MNKADPVREIDTPAENEKGTFAPRWSLLLGAFIQMLFIGMWISGLWHPELFKFVVCVVAFGGFLLFITVGRAKSIVGGICQGAVIPLVAYLVFRALGQ